MSDSNGVPSEVTANPAPLAPPVGPRGKVVLAWLVILGLGVAVIAMQSLGKQKMLAEQGDDSGGYALLELQSRFRVGAANALEGKADPNTRAGLAQQTAEFNRGSIGQRFRVIIALGELDGPQRAKSELEDLTALINKTEHSLTPSAERRLDILTRLYTDYVDGRPNAPTVNPEERGDLASAFGWFGDLALGLATADAQNAERQKALAGARNTLLALSFASIVVVIAFTLGAIGLFLLGIIWYQGRWRSRLGPPVPHHGVYVETFALWLAIYFSLLAAIPKIAGDRLTGPVATCLAMALSLSVLAWPTLRGIPWNQARRDVGITLGDKPLLEPILGFFSYLIALPLLGIGLVAMLINTFFYHVFIQAPRQGNDPFHPDASMSHPLNEQLARGSIEDFLPLFLMACVMAPIMEEIAFRGLLYRHLRDATRPWRLGFLVSVFVVSLLFAVVHPQGLLTVPVLAGLASGFALAREWRGTLIPAIIAHGLNNALFLSLQILASMK